MGSLRIWVYAAMALCAFVAQVAIAQPVSALRYEFVGTTVPTSFVRTFSAPAAAFTVNAGNSTNLQLTAADSGGSAVLLLAAAAGHAFAPGPAELAVGFDAAPGTHPQIGLSAFPSCSPGYARFVILEIAFDSAFQLATLAVDFEMRCFNGNVFGELRLNSTLPLTVDKPPGSTTPDPFAFFPVKDVLPGALATSNTTTIYGIRALAPISIAGGEYSVNLGPYTSAPGLVADRDLVTVRRTGSPDVATTASATLTVGGVSAAFDVTTFTPGVPFSAIALRSGPSPDGLTPAFQQEFHAPDWRITASRSTATSLLSVNASGPTSGMFFRFTPPGDLVPGVYEEAGPDTVPTMDVFGTPCTQLAGRFIIHEISTGIGGTVDRLAASFEQWCLNRAPIFGEIRINSPMPLPSMVLGADTTPYPFALRAQSPVAAGAIVRSNRTVIDGVNQPVPVSVAGGEYSLNGGPFTSTPGFANPGDEVVVQLAASRFAGGRRSATFTAGGVSSTMGVQTYAPATPLSGLYFQGPRGAFPADGIASLMIPSAGGFSIRRPFGNVVEANAIVPGMPRWTLDLAAPSGERLAVRSYENATRPFNGSMAPGLDFFNVRSSCGSVFGRFNVLEAAFDVAGNPQRLAVDFEHHCENATAPVTVGELRYNSTVPFSALLAGNPCIATDPGCINDLAIEQALPSVLDIGSVGTVTLTARNSGPATAHNVVVSDMLPVSLALESVPPACSLAARRVSCLAEELASGASVSFALPLRAMLDGSFTNTATIAAEEIETHAADNTSTRAGSVHTDAAVVNLSTRGQVLGGADVMIGGFIIGGATPKTVVVTATGPALVAAGISNALPNPVLTLFRSSDGTVIATNDDWRAADNAADIEAAGFALANDRESAIMMTLPPGAYTAMVSGAGGTTGVGIVAVYEVDHPESPLVNISTRGRVFTGGDVMIGGFVVQGTLPRTVVVTGIGPSLTAAGVPSALANPVLTLFRSSDGAQVATNDDWGTAANAAQIQAVGLGPANVRESAIMMTLQPGAYTAILSGAGGSTGVGLIAVYTLP